MGRALTRRNLLDNQVDILNTRVLDFHRRRITNAADAIDRQDYVTLRQLLELISGLSPGGGSGTNQFQSYTMNAAPYSVPDVTVVNGDSLLVYLFQDGSGSRYPVWNGAFYQYAPVTFDPTPGSLGIVGFVGNGGLWKWDGRHVSGI